MPRVVAVESAEAVEKVDKPTLVVVFDSVVDIVVTLEADR